MLFKNALKYLFVGVSVFSFGAVKADEDSSIAKRANLLKGFEAHHSHHSYGDKHHHIKLTDLVDLFLLGDFRFSASQFAASSAERTFDVWGGAASVSQAASNDVIGRFTIANAISAAIASNALLGYDDVSDFIDAWVAFAEGDIDQTNDPSALNTLAFIEKAFELGKLYDQSIFIHDQKFIHRVRTKLESITANFSPTLKKGELYQKIQSISADETEFPLFEILFGLYGLARSGTNFTASIAHGVADTDAPAAEIIYVDSQILNEAGFLIMDLITLAITLVDFIDHDNHSHHNHSRCLNHSR